MTIRENARRCINFASPAYLPSDIGVDFDFLLDKDPAKQDTIRQLIDNMPREFRNWLWCWMDSFDKVENVTTKTEEWGTLWQDSGNGFYTTWHPMEEGYEYINRVSFPKAQCAGRFDKADAYLAQKQDDYVQSTVWFTLFERLWMLRGFNNMLMDPYLHEHQFLDLKERVVQVNLDMIDQWLARDVDCVYFSDDWGSQRSLLISPEDWRKYYKDDYRRMFRRVRDAGKHVWMHLCGNIEAILPDLIDMGLSVLNPVQPQAMDVDMLAKKYAGSVTFCGGVDVQGTMVRGTPQQVQREFHHLVKIFGGEKGGYIAGTSHSIMPETPLDNVVALFEALKEYR